MSGQPRVRRAGDVDDAARVLRSSGRAPLLTGSAPSDPSELPRRARRALEESGRDLLSTERLAGIDAYRPEDLTVVVGTGTRVESLQRRLRAEGQWLPLPGSALDRSVGGLVASAPTTPYAAEYGPVRRQVLAVRTVSYDGELYRWGRGVVKDVAGYDLPRLACGSRGRLGLLARVTFRVWPLPRERRRYAVRDPDGGSSPVSVTVGVDAGEDWRPAAEAWSWRPDGDDRPPLVVELAGAGAAVEARERRLLGWAAERGLEVRERTLEEPPSPIPPRRRSGGEAAPRPPGLRFRVHPRYVGRTVAALRRSGDPSRIVAYPREGVVRADGGGGRALDVLEAGAEAAPGAAALVERGQPDLHEAADARRDDGRVAVEGRVIEALGGRRRAWAADYV